MVKDQKPGEILEGWKTYLTLRTYIYLYSTYSTFYRNLFPSQWPGQNPWSGGDPPDPSPAMVNRHVNPRPYEGKPSIFGHISRQTYPAKIIFLETWDILTPGSSGKRHFIFLQNYLYIIHIHILLINVYIFL